MAAGQALLEAREFSHFLELNDLNYEIPLPFLTQFSSSLNNSTTVANEKYA